MGTEVGVDVFLNTEGKLEKIDLGKDIKIKFVQHILVG